MQELGRKLDQLPMGKIYLHAPTDMKVGDRRNVDARVGVNVPDDILRGRARTGDQTGEASLHVSHEMIATLDGPGFMITLTTPEKQAVAEGFPTVWEWDVEAKQDGMQELEVALYALVPDTSGTARHRIDSHTQKVNVSVKPQTWSEWLKSVGEEIDAVKAIAIAIGGFATAALGWLGLSLTRRGKQTRAAPRKSKRHVAS